MVLYASSYHVSLAQSLFKIYVGFCSFFSSWMSLKLVPCKSSVKVYTELTTCQCWSYYKKFNKVEESVIQFQMLLFFQICRQDQCCCLFLMWTFNFWVKDTVKVLQFIFISYSDSWSSPGFGSPHNLDSSSLLYNDKPFAFIIRIPFSEW